MRVTTQNVLPALHSTGAANLASAVITDVAVGANKDYVSFVNAGPEYAWIYAIRVSKSTSGALTGLVRRMTLSVATAHSSGSAVTPVVLYGAAVPSGMTVINAGTVTKPGSVISHGASPEEESGAGGVDTILWPASSFPIPLPIKPGSGFVVTNDATAGGGVVSVTIIFGY